LVAAYLGELERGQGRRHGRAIELEPRFAALLPEVLIGVSPARFAAIAAEALTPKAPPVIGIEHIHAPRVSVREHMAVLRDRLSRHGSATFRALVADCESTLDVVARFLGLLELYREGSVAFDQVAALAELRVRWIATGSAPDEPTATVELEEEYG
jgi:segregation and condensation protein A